MDDKVTIRRVRPADASRVRALRLEMLADAPLAFITTLAEAAAMPHEEWVGRAERASAGSESAQFVADVEGRLVAMAGAFEHPNDPARTLIVSVYVTPAHRGGATLAGIVGAAAEWSLAAGRPMLELEVVTTNGRAVRAYQKLGFVTEGGPVPHPKIPSLHEQIMVRPA